MSFPDGYLLDGLIVFPNVASRGFELALPDLREAGPAVLNEFAATWQNFLLQLPEGVRLSFQSNRSADFTLELSRYAKDTSTTTNAWSRRVREERYTRYIERMRAGQLVRQRTILFVSVRLEDMPDLFSSPFGLEDRYRGALQAAGVLLQHVADQLARLLAAHGGHLTALTDAEHHRYFARFLNPSLTNRPEFDPLVTFDPAQSIHANCWWSEAAGGDYGFFMDGHYHALRVFSRLPSRLSPESLQPLWELEGLNCRVTVNLRSLVIQNLIEREERELRRLQGQYAAERKPSLLPTIEKKQKRVEALASRVLRPFKVEIILHAWAPTKEALATQCAIAEQAIQATGSQYYSPTLPTTSKRLFGQTWPGYPWGSYSHYQLYAESTYVPDLLPLIASFTGYVDEAEALFESPNGSLVGIRTSSGGQPHHAIVLGGTGAGKSMWLGDFISQVALFFASIVLVDSGGSHETVARALDPGCQSLVLHPNSGTTINYLERPGLPLTNEHLGDVATLVALMSGSTGNERDDRLRRVAVVEALRSLHTSRFNQLERTEPERALAVARHALAIRQPLDANADTIEAFIDFRDWQAAHPDEAKERLARFTEEEAVSFLKDLTTRPEAIRLACASWQPSEQPTHRELQEWLHLRGLSTRDPLVADLAKIMEDFSRGGAGGQLFDGLSTIDLKRPILHLELGRLDQRNPALLAAAGHLAQLLVMRRNLTLPRRVRKFVLFEEASALLALPGAEALMRRCYEQARKLNVVLVAVFQNYSRLRELPLCPALLGNAQQFILLKQDGLPDLKQLVEDLGLPASMMSTMSQFPRPANAGYADFTLFSRDTPHPVCGVVRHVPSKEMHYITHSTPAHIEARRAALRGEGDLMTRIQQAVS